MLTINYSKKGLSTNIPISERLFDQVRNTLVRVVCNPYYYGSPESLENMVCDYMSEFMPEGMWVNTFHVTTDCSTGTDSSGRTYVKELIFQVYV